MHTSDEMSAEERAYRHEAAVREDYERLVRFQYRAGAVVWAVAVVGLALAR